MNSDTIAAIATGMWDAGIGIIRVSGDEALKVVDGLYRSKGGKRRLLDFAPNTIHYGVIVEAERMAGDDPEWIGGRSEEQVVDEVMVSVMKAPHSYTMEDTVEINCHGGLVVLNRILELVLRHGARLAEPGEFTKRAYLNGRMDLSEAEAVMDIIRSRNAFALENSVKQLQGSVSKVIRQLRGEILYETAYIESALDDPEHVSLEGYAAHLDQRLGEIAARIASLLRSADNGRLMKEGIDTVIVGKPNAGKSSLLNVLAGEERAIVTDVAGTTRDALEESVVLNGICLNVVDTAGIRDTEDRVEKIGVEKAKKYAREADLIVYVADASVPLDESDREIFALIGKKKTIVLLNKTDLPSVVTEEGLREELRRADFQDQNLAVVKTSTLDSKGIEEFSAAVREMFFHGEIEDHGEAYITNIRHKEALRQTLDSILQVKKSVEAHMPEDFYSIDLRDAYASLGRIIGEEVGDDLVEEIFSRFCMGK